MRVLTDSGIHWVEVTDDLDASDVGTYWNAVRKYLHTGDGSGIWALEGRAIEGVELLTDLDDVDFWALRGELEFEDIYEGD
jgi:hypothetical protein